MSIPANQRPKHLAIFVRAFDGSGGAERNMLNLCIGLVSLGYRVDLVMARRRGHYLDLIPPEIRVVDLEVTSAKQSLPMIFRLGRDAWFWALMVLARKPHYVLGALPGLIEYLRNERPAALISAMDYPNVVAVLARDLAKVKTKVVITVRNTLSEEVARSKKRRVKDQVIVDKRFYPRADHVVAVSKGVAVDLAQTLDMPIEDIKTIYNPIVTDYLLRQAGEPLEHPWFNDNGPPVILAVGGFKPAKDHATLMEAFSLVRKDRPVRLLLLGEGKLRERIKTQAEKLGVVDDVEMPGFVDNPFKYLANSSVFVLSSVFEGLPSVLIQALACGCPVVSTDCPSGPKEILENGRYGALVTVGDAAAMAAAIVQSLDTPQKKSVLISRGRDFSIERATKEYLKLIDHQG